MLSLLYRTLQRPLRYAVVLCVFGPGLTGCVDELVVGVRQPLQELDSSAPDEQDADLWPDAEPLEDAQADARPPADASPPPPPDAGSEDASCGSPRCGPSTRGPCYSCEVVVFIGPATTCKNGAPEACWDDGSGTCTVSCPGVAGCTENSDCAADEYCFFPKRDCGAGSRGLCAPRLLDCPDTVNSACGCDGLLYTNACQAVMKGQDFYKDELASCK